MNLLKTLKLDLNDNVKVVAVLIKLCVLGEVLTLLAPDLVTPYNV